MTKKRKKRSVIWNEPREILSQIVANSTSYSEILRKLDIFTSGSNIRTLKTRISYEGIDTSHIPKGLDSNKNRKRGIQIVSPLEEIFCTNSKHARSKAKKYILKKQLIPYICQNCNMTPVWCNKPLVLVLDHINGIANDHRLENLRFLCPNCNSQTDTFCGKNVKLFCGPIQKIEPKPRIHKSHTEEAKLKMSLAAKTSTKRFNPTKGNRWINKDGKNMLVSIQELDGWLNDSWNLGLIKKV